MPDTNDKRALKSEETGGYVLNRLNEIRCPGCGKLLFMALGLGAVIETICPRCGKTVVWPFLYPEIVRPGEEE